MTPIGFVTKLAALIPPPRQHQVRYFGVLASASPLRAAVVPHPQVRLRAPPQAEPVDVALELPPTTRISRARWAALHRRVYDVDALELLEHDGLYDEPPEAKPPRDDPAFDFG